MLTVHRAERADRLVDALASVVIDPLPDPFTPEVVAVPTRGIERWLTQCLSTVLGTSPDRHDGVCANIDFPFPGRVVGGAMAAASDIDPDDDPWLPERAVWPLMEVVDEHLGDGWMAALVAHLGGATDPADETMRSRRFGAVRHLADLFDRYAVHRPSMIEAWVAGDDTDGLGDALPPDVAWQATLWRHLRDRLAVPSPAERLTAGCARLRDDPDLSDLPPRFSLFGLTRLPASHVEVLDALATARDVHLFLLHPSPELWTRISAQATIAFASCDAPTTPPPPCRATRSWPRGAATRARCNSFSGLVAPTSTTPPRPRPAHCSTGSKPASAPTRRHRVPRSATKPTSACSSIRPTTACACTRATGGPRQVEVLRDAILHLLADDPTLEPRDVIVMCPDIETFAPLIQATFGAVERDEPASPASGLPDLRVRLADRSLRQTNPVLGAVSELLTLVDARITASQLLDFASREPVRRMFRLDDDDLARLEDWIAATGIRWGLDAAHRAPYQLDALAENTWRTGLDRLLLGVTMAEDDLRLVGDVLPLDDVDSGDIELAGRLAELVDRILTAVDELSPPKPIEAWVQAIASAADTLTATSDRDAWQRAELDRILGDVITEAAAGTAVDLSLVEVRALLADRLRGRPTRANFRTGHLTICTLVPMRSVPHRVVCLLGLDDGVFPRRTAPDGDDIIERAPCVGDRDPRSEDRQLLLDALQAATDHLVITYSGRDERTNAVRPPAVPLGELLDVVDGTARAASGSARDQVCVHHPLQPFDPRNFALRRAGRRPTVELRRRRSRRRPRRGRRSRYEGAIPAGATGARRQLTGGARRPRSVRPAPGQGLPAPAPRGLGQRRGRRAGRLAARRPRQPRAVERGRSDPRTAPRRIRRGRMRRRRSRTRRSTAGHAR